VTSTSTRRPGTIDPDRWPDVAVAAGPPGRAAVARVLFGTAIVRLLVRVLLPDGSLHGAGGPADPVMRLHRPREFFRRLGASGLIGFGESYLAGEWDSTDLTRLLARTTLRITGREEFGAHYAETLRIWRERFGARADEVTRLGFDEVFNRMWTFFLCYSEAGFRAGYIDVSQLTLARI
jgi:mycolic acid cyclopropane synthetase